MMFTVFRNSMQTSFPQSLSSPLNDICKMMFTFDVAVFRNGLSALRSASRARYRLKLWKIGRTRTLGLVRPVSGEEILKPLWSGDNVRPRRQNTRNPLALHSDSTAKRRF